MAVAPLTTYNLPHHMAGQQYQHPHGHYAQSERAVTVRRASSISSRSSVGRRHHRSHRSHAGGAAYAPQNEFPNFALSGDVEIVISADGQERRYVLHRLILAQNSGFFEASMSEQWSRAKAQEYASGSGRGGGGGLSAIGEDGGSDRGRDGLDKGGQRLTWRYELDWGPEGHSDDIPMLVQKPPQPSIFGGEPAPKPPSSRGKPPASSSGLFRSLSVMQSAMSGAPAPAKDAAPAIESDTIRDYDNMFRIFYNYAPQLDVADITEAYIQCKMLLNLADMYDALDVVGPRIDHHLLQFQARLWKQIAKYPPSYLKLGYLARSRSIFAEALAHVVGQWPLGAPQLREMPDGVLDLIEDKAADLAELQTRIEARLLRLSLTNSKGERVSPHSSYLDWSAVAFFRGWIADHTVPVALPVGTAAGRHGSRTAAAGAAAGAPSTALTTTTHAGGGALLGGAGPGTGASHRHHVPVSRAGTVVSASGTTAAPPQAPVRAPARAFRVLGQGGQAYLTHDECKRFARLLPAAEAKSSAKDTLRRFERRIDDLKHQARETVRPLLRSGLQLEASVGSGGHRDHRERDRDREAPALLGVGLPYLTCTRVDEEEWPW